MPAAGLVGISTDDIPQIVDAIHLRADRSGIGDRGELSIPIQKGMEGIGVVVPYDISLVVDTCGRVASCTWVVDVCECAVAEHKARAAGCSEILPHHLTGRIDPINNGCG